MLLWWLMHVATITAMHPRAKYFPCSNKKADRFADSPYPISAQPTGLTLVDPKAQAFTRAQTVSFFAMQGLLAQKCPQLWYYDPTDKNMLLWLDMIEQSVRALLDCAQQKLSL